MPRSSSTEPETPAEEPTYDPETQIMGADGEVKPMPTGEWTAAVTDSGNLRHSSGLLVEG